MSPHSGRRRQIADFIAVNDPIAELAAEFDFVLAPVLAGLFAAHTA